MKGIQKNGDSSANTELRDGWDVQEQVLRSSGNNPLLEQTNLGLGNYDDSYLWQQIDSYRKGLYMWLAFEDTVSKKAIRETKIKLARDGFSYYDERKGTVEQWQPLNDDDVDEDQSIWTAELERGQEIWESLNDTNEILSDKQAVALMKKANVDLDWLPIFWQLLDGRHEVSRSRHAELLRALLTKINHLRDDADSDVAKGILGGS